ncbi:MAG TPA: ABC transporter permease [Candidatus Acidoferrales bacterium]|nr:ABC transporter permease [Candidatus Acidoferrales bacterium]
MFKRRRKTSDFSAEIEAHIQLEIERLREQGMSEADARAAAQRAFGSKRRAREEFYESGRAVWLEHFWQDIRFGIRMLGKAPGFTAVALMTLALGIGANTAIFSVVYAVLLRPLPFRDASRLVLMNETTPRVGLVSVSYMNFLDWRAQSRAFSEMATVAGTGFNMSGMGQPQTIRGEAVSVNFLSMVGMRPYLGRDFSGPEEKAGTPAVIMLSYDLWQSHFGGDASAIGKTVRLDDKSVTIVGVMPKDFRWLEKADFLEPIGVWATGNSTATERAERGDSIVVGRLASGVTFAQAKSEMDGIAARLEHEFPEANDQFGVALQPLRDSFVGQIRPAILVLLGAVIFVLFVACANVANLFLMRGASRTREMAMRLAIGASRGRIIRQMLAESFVIAILGGLGGIVLAVGGIDAMEQLVPAGMFSGATIDLNGAVLAFSAGVAILSMFIFGLAPAIRSSRADVQAELKDGGRTASDSAAANRWRAALATTEVSLALVLLVGAGLMVKSLSRLLSVNPGIRPDHVLTMHISLRTQQYDKDPEILNFWRRVLSGIRALPGVEAAGEATGLPLLDEHWRTDVYVEGSPVPTPGKFPHPDMHVVTPGYLSAAGTRLLRGRDFTEADDTKSPLVALINKLAAAQLYPNEDPIGKRFMRGHPGKDKPQWVTIVGEVEDTKMYGLANPARLEFYLPLEQAATSEGNLVVKSAVDPAALTSAIRGTVNSVDPDEPISDITTMTQAVEDSVSAQRLVLILLSLFSGLGLVLAAIGIYGVISYSVAQRTHEIGIRIALGAQPGDVVRLILRDGLRIAGAGLLIGGAASLALTRLMSKLLYAVSASDPATFIEVTAILVCMALLACYIPARRTTRVSPVVALRHE